MSENKTKGIVTLDYIVSLYLLDIQDYSSRESKRALQYACLALTEINLYVADYPAQVEVTVLPNNTIDLPEDYIGFINLGMLQNGRIEPLSRNDDIGYAREMDDCGDVVGHNRSCDADFSDDRAFSLDGFYYFAPQIRNGQYVGEQYGAGGGEGLSSYRIDRTRRQIVLDRKLPSSVGKLTLVYTNSGINPAGSTVVERQYVQVIRAYVHWQMKAYGKSVTESAKARLEQQYNMQYEKALLFESLFTKQEYLDQFNRDIGPIVRR